ncbi:23S rRNA (guanosine(2251)-2'-O)-methyltransferase RlmB [Nitrospira moscoviensis]|uniref:Putative TrmH family tRNA/rRNA methyltransferase YacO n=1 Tax=Nitrospira moscoviensis TaxID=42253 RepID=A0A0K2GJM8_NITMO|nr:23S rRNA (guanosine(2251)-2'-O)-methyltransferase RlmB [Nitrospira moscoviensis]ALA60832.1 putative TrmH family tRNA/rRNA methyltransferase YacO [Nitrospira moscoviensis]
MAPAAGNGEQEILYGLHAVREALRAGARPLQRLLVVRTDKQFTDLVKLARAQHVPVLLQPAVSLDRLVPGGKHQGIVAFAAAAAYQTEEAILARAAKRREPPLLVILDGVEDPHNVGAVLRTAEAAGVHGVFIPERRAAGLTSVVAKVSAGAIDHIAVARVTNTSRLLESLKEAGVWIYGLDPTATKWYTDIDMRGPVGFVFGGEGKGLRPGVLQHCDDRIGIPMKGHVRSLNVSASAAVALFEAVRQRDLPPAKP